jgi:uncharacterized membrane protein
MKARITLIVEWEPSETGNGDAINSVGDLAGYIEGTIESNAGFDNLEISIKDILVSDI